MTDMPFRLSMGAEVRDQITGFQGVITARTQWINGCIRYEVTPQGLNEDGSVRAAHWVDEGQLDVVSPGIQSEAACQAIAGDVRPGGPMPDPTL